jgi:hypothetical protein
MRLPLEDSHAGHTSRAFARALYPSFSAVDAPRVSGGCWVRARAAVTETADRLQGAGAGDDSAARGLILQTQAETSRRVCSVQAWPGA